MARGTEKGEGKREKEIRIEREYKGERKHVQRKIEREPGQKHKGWEEERDPARITLRPWAV